MRLVPCSLVALPRFSGILLGLLLLSPLAVLAHAGHGEDFQGHSETSQPSQAIQVDGEAAQRLGFKVEPVTRRQLAFGIKTTGQIESLPDRQVEVTAPIRSTVVKLLVKPGDGVAAGQAVAILSSPDLVELRADSIQKRAEAEANLRAAQADLRLAQENYSRQQHLAAVDIQQALPELRLAQDRFNRDQELVVAGAISRRQFLESETQLAQARAAHARAASRPDVVETEAQIRRAESAVAVARSQLPITDVAYTARLRQLGATNNADGTFTVKAPIGGTIADREATLGESTEDAGKPLMTIQNNSSVWATANIYEKDLASVKVGQGVRVTVASLPNQTFQGSVAVIDPVVEGEKRTVPVKVALNNPNGLLKPGGFAELEILTDRTTASVLVIPESAVVDAKGKPLVFVQNGNGFQPVEVRLGEASEGFVEVKQGLFEGDQVVTQRAPQLYAESLRTGGKPAEAEATPEGSSGSGVPLPWWLLVPAGGAIAAGSFWVGRRTQRRRVLLPEARLDPPVYDAEVYPDPAVSLRAAHNGKLNPGSPRQPSETTLPPRQG